jgi:hypothetical protein
MAFQGNARTFLVKDLLSDETRGSLQRAGYFLTHLCWPILGYYYVWQLPDSPKGICLECGKKYSLALPTTGKMESA